MRKVLSIKQQAELFDNVLQQRLGDLLPTLMKRQGISMWIVMNREYNEDPVYLSLVPAMARYARRLSCLIFYLNGQGKTERYSLGNDRDFKGMYTVIPWAPPQDRMQLLRETIERLNPDNIALDYCQDNQFADAFPRACTICLKRPVPGDHGQGHQRRAHCHGLAPDPQPPRNWCDTVR